MVFFSLIALVKWKGKHRRRTNVQQRTCKIDLPNSFYYLFFSFVLLELKPFVYKWKVLGEKFWKSAKKCEKKCENYETTLPFSFCPLVFPWNIAVFPRKQPKSLERRQKRSKKQGVPCTSQKQGNCLKLARKRRSGCGAPQIRPPPYPPATPAFSMLGHLASPNQQREKKSVYRHQSPSLFLKRPCNGEKWPVLMIFPFFSCRSICTGGGGSRIRPNKKSKMSSGWYQYQNLLFQ